MSARISTFFLFLYILSIGFHRLFEFPIFGDKVQLPEIIFIFLFLFSLPSIINGLKNQLFSRINLGIFLYVLAVSVSCIFNPKESGVWLELLGLVYLVLLYLTVFAILQKKPLESLPMINKWFIYGGLIAGILGILGFILSSLGVVSSLAWSSARYYPYFGHIARAEGFAASANMLLSILSIPILYLIWKSSHRKTKHLEKVILLVLLIAAVLTFSKMLLGLFICILILVYSRYTQWRKIIQLVSLLLFLVLIFGTHIIVLKQAVLEKEEFKKEAYIIGDPVWQDDSYAIFPTNYTINKSISIAAGLLRPFTGIGPGQQNQFVLDLKAQGKIPTSYGNYDPHSTFFGAFGELGFLGLSALLFLILTISKAIRKIFTDHRDISYLFISVFTFALIDAISLDIMNFRHYWVYLALLSVNFLSLPKSIKTS